MQYLLLFLGGTMAFLSPCHLPLLPAFISFFAAGESNRKRAFINSLGFVSGFTIVFIVLGAFAGTLGSLIHEHIVFINIIAGSAVILLGLNFLGIIKIHALGHTDHKTAETKTLRFFPSLLFGLVFSISWTPCAGAFILSALTIASIEGKPLQGIFMLLVFSMGLGLPYIISALLIDKLKGVFAFIRRNMSTINLISGGLLVIVGILIATGLMEQLLSLLEGHSH